MKIAVSYLKSKLNIDDTINEINKTNADYLHIDVMDGIFVKNKCNIYDDVYYSLLKSNKLLDVHLMVDNPIIYILKYKDLKPDYITIHYEIDKNIDDLIDLIHSYNIKCGISIKPNTSVSKIKQYLDKIENVLIMSVEPGMGGQKFLDSSINKIDDLIKLRNVNNYNYIISIDGGINKDTIKYCRNVDLVISGSFICMSDNYQDKIDELKIRFK